MTLTFDALLAEESLAHLSESLCPIMTLADAQALLAANRVAFLAKLKDLGVGKLGERQRLANALSKAEKAGRIGTAVPTPYMRPCTWTQTTEALTVRLMLPGGTASHQVEFELDVNSLTVRVGGERTSIAGRLAALVKPADSTWELERAPPAEMVPYEPEAAQPKSEDVMVISLIKARPGQWASLFHGGGSLARQSDELPNAPTVPAPAPAPAPSPMKPASLAARQPLPLGGNKAQSTSPGATGSPSPCAFVPRKLQLGGGAAGRVVSNSEPSRSNAGAVDAKDHWMSEGATLLWRDGAGTLTTKPDGPEPEGPLFWWSEDVHTVKVTARTRKGLDPASASLDLTTRSADLSVDGRATPWCGMLCGRIDAERSGVSVQPDATRPWDLLVLTLVKAEKQLWRAPWTELLPTVEQMAKRRSLPARHELLGGGSSWQSSQAREAWTVILPLRDGLVGEDDLRVAVTSDAFNVYLDGQEEMPLLAGELHGRVNPDKCSWALKPAPPAPASAGGHELVELTLILRKAEPKSWPDLIKTWYT